MRHRLALLLLLAVLEGGCDAGPAAPSGSPPPGAPPAPAGAAAAPAPSPGGSSGPSRVAPGPAQPGPRGAVTGKVRLDVDRARLGALGGRVDDLRTALGRAGLQVEPRHGEVDTLWAVRTSELAPPIDLEKLSHQSLFWKDGAHVALRDVARISLEPLR